MRLTNGFACILSALMICAAVGCGRRTDSGDKSEVKGGEHVKSGIQYQKAPVLTGSSEVYSVMDFGAVGNGRADDTQAIQNAIDLSLIHIFIESGTKTVKAVKSHHNVGGLPADLDFQLVELSLIPILRTASATSAGAGYTMSRNIRIFTLQSTAKFIPSRGKNILLPAARTA